jgi:hypothetical protein
MLEAITRVALRGPPRAQQNHFLGRAMINEGDGSYKSTQTGTQEEPKNLRPDKEKIVLNPPLGGATFVVKTEPHTGARPSVRLCVGLTSAETSDHE